MKPRLQRGQQGSPDSRPFRKILFWLHLCAGVAAGAVILVMSVTGVLLTYERQITEWADRGYRVAPPGSGTARLPVEALVAGVVAAGPGKPSAVTMQADPSAPVAVSLGRERTVYVDPYSGKILGEGSKKVRAFFHAVTDWHRWLGGEDERREVGRAVTGASNLTFLVLVLSGIYLWLPRVWARRQVRNIAWFRRGLAGKARDFNWHNVIGLWCWGPLVLIVLTGVVMSYPWANDLLFRLAGDEPPARQSGGPGGTGGSGGQGRGGESSGEAEAVNLDGLDELWRVAEGRVAGWRTLTLRLPGSPDDPVSFTILQGGRGRPDLRAQLSLDRASGEVVKWEPYASQGLGRRLRAWSRWVHTGEAGGAVGQTVAGLASAGTAVLVWTGIALAWRRLVAARLRRRIDFQPAATRRGEPGGAEM